MVDFYEDLDKREALMSKALRKNVVIEFNSKWDVIYRADGGIYFVRKGEKIS